MLYLDREVGGDVDSEGGGAETARPINLSVYQAMHGNPDRI